LIFFKIKIIIGKKITSKSYNKWRKASLFEITPQDMLNYLALEYSTTLIKMKHLRWYWKTENTSDGLFGNQFFKETMSWSKFNIIRRGFQADIDEFMIHYNQISQEYYFPSLMLAIDDDLDKSESRSSETVHIERKA
jgi:Transposase IS4